MYAKRNFLGRLTDMEANFALEPLPLRIHQGNQCDRNPKDMGRKLRQVIKRRFRLGIEDAITVQGLETG